MRKSYVMCLIILILLLPSCGHKTDNIPYGKWECAAVNLVMDIDPAVEGYYNAYMVKDGVKTNLLVAVAYWNEFDIFDASDRDEESQILNISNPIYAGEYKLKNGKIGTVKYFSQIQL